MNKPNTATSVQQFHIHADQVVIAGTDIPSPLFQYLGQRYGNKMTASVPEWQWGPLKPEFSSDEQS